jgi:threonine/homoserine/homoserine lactone efflux protein
MVEYYLQNGNFVKSDDDALAVALPLHYAWEVCMNTTVAILGIAGAIAAGAISPGPSFVMVARTAVASSRSDGFAAALGMGVGGVVFALAALLGLHILLSSVPWLYFIVKLVGGAYLAYLGYRIWRGATLPLALGINTEATPAHTLTRSFVLGLGTQLSNPKTAIVYASIFAALLPRDVPLPLFVGLPIIIFAIETGWYAIVAFVLSSASPRAAYLRHKALIDRAAGGVMVLLGIKLVYAVHKEL